MSFKKKVNGSWVDTPNYIHKTDTDILTTLPTVVYPTGTTATVGLKGQMEQNGTPTPDNPIQPQETGDLETVGGQYKIPISSAGQTTPVYLGEVETTRRIRKLVLTGTNADGNINITTQGIIYITPLPTLKNVRNAYCSHYEYIDQNQGSSMPNNSFTTNGGAGSSLWFKTEYATVADFKSFLAQQYAAGTPVIVWYVLATPTTGIVNEPLRKIGDYADEVSGITIPTIAGGDTIDVDTTLKPSEVSVNYKGWHPITDVHRFNGTSWN